MITRKVDQYFIDHNVSFKIKFVPASECPAVLERRINWKVTLTKRRINPQGVKTKCLHFNCWQHLGYLPHYNPADPNVSNQIDVIAMGTEHQLQIVTFGERSIHEVKRLETPDSAYVIKQLLTDSRVLNYRSLRVWAQDRNVNFNSRLVKIDYWSYMINAIKLQSIFNETEQIELNAIVENYG